MKRNPNLAKLPGSYLFPEIRKRKEAFLEKHPDAKLISLSIGDTTEPLPPFVATQLAKKAQELGTREGYFGYGPEQGIKPLREKIAEILYHNKIEPDEVFVSDGAKCDIARFQVLFGKDVKTAVQDPSYPVYVDTSVIIGQTSHFDTTLGRHLGLIYLECTPENNFCPKLDDSLKADLIYFCSPNNPTGATSSREYLKELVAFAKRNRSIIIFDAAYSLFIQDEKIPKSIYEIEGAKEVAIEIGSFSKLIGFTGVRLSCSVVPKELHFDDGSSVHKDWVRIMTTCFNGSSIISQYGGIAALEEEGLKEMKDLINFYMENTALLKETLISLGFEVFGGEHIPYLWVRLNNRSSWELFNDLLEKTHIVTTPGSGFGKFGEGFVRFSAFSNRENLLEAIERLKNCSIFTCSL